MNSKSILLLLLAFATIKLTFSIKTVNNFESLGKLHCSTSPIELIYRLSTGQLAEKYGKKYQDLDCYIRQFVNKDGQDKFDEEEVDEDGEIIGQEEQIPEIDPLVVEYAKGLEPCLPQTVNSVEAVYAIWRFYRFVIQHDYSFEWMRAKIRSALGYEAEKPNAWMDGEQSAVRLRLDKLFSNQFYDYVDTLMFRNFLHPIMTFLQKNFVIAVNGQLTRSGKPILLQYIQSKNLIQSTFVPIIFQHKEAGNIFSYTLPGIPLLLGGSSKKLSWAFTGVLVDRSNIQPIQTVGNKFFHHGSQEWIKLQNVTFTINVKDQEPAKCFFVHSSYGTLYEKHSSDGKASEYIARWHEKEKKVRVLFSQLFDFIVRNGHTDKNLEFPFNSLLFANQTGIYNYLCFQAHPSYFLYPDLAGAPEPSKDRWVSNPKRNVLVVSNTLLSTINQHSYLKKEVHNPTEEQFLLQIRKATQKDKFTLESLTDLSHSISTNSLIKKRKDQLIYIYRKAKFLFFPDQSIRKECDQLIAYLQKWDHNLNSQTISPIFILWDYFFREYTFNHVSSSAQGRNIAKHKVLSDVYWTNQMELWKVGTSYGECDSNQWENEYRQKLNGTGENSTCFFNIMRGINRTRQVLRGQEGGIKEARLSDFTEKKILKITQNYIGTHIQEAFSQFFSKNVAFTAQIGNNKIIYLQSYKEIKKDINLENPTIDQDESVQTADSRRGELDTDL